VDPEIPSALPATSGQGGWHIVLDDGCV